MAEASTPIEVLCCYSHLDETWLRRLETHLSLLQREGLISLWHDRLILPSADRAKAIDICLETASVILLLVSADFLASDYCYSVEMRRALERQEAGEARVVPILIRPVDWKGAPFAHLHALPTNANPIASWRNKDQALADVAAGIRRVIEDAPLLAASAPRAALPTIWNIPYPRNPFFLGRERELAQVRHYLQRGQTMALSQPQAISGLGGIGKTSLALEYAYRYHQDYKAVLWAHAESTEALVSSYVTIALLLRLPEREAKEQGIAVQAVKAWLQIHCDWLLILDNADELKLLPDFLPPNMGGHLLLTTRAAATGQLAHRMEIETLEPAQGALLLLRRGALLAPDATLEQASQEEQELAVQISQELGGLPLALDQAGAYLEATGIDLASYWHIYQQHRADLLKGRGGLVADHPAPVATTWSLSFQRVEEKNPAAADLLHLCAFLSPDDIPEDILIADSSVLGPTLAPMVANVFRRNQAIEALRAYSLVQRDPKEKTISIHRLVQAALQDTLEVTETRTWAERAVLAVNAAFSKIEHGAISSLCERLLPHALLATHHIETDHISSLKAALLLDQVALYLKAHTRHTEAEPLYLRALQIREQQLGPDHLDVAESLSCLAHLYLLQGKYTEAEPLGLRALQIREQQLGPEHPLVAQSLNNLANIYGAQSKYAEAEPLYLQALAIFEQQLGLEHLDMTYTLTSLAFHYDRHGKYAEAEQFHQRALRIREQHRGPEHPDVAHSLNNLATFYRYQHKYTEAEPLYLRALAIFEQQLGPEHPYIAESLNSLANLYYDQCKYAEAEALYHRALQIKEQQLGPEHPLVAVTMYDFARLREAQSNSEEARSLYARVLVVRERALGAHHPKTAETRKSLIALLHAMGRHEEATWLEAIHTEP